ncbi:hypothetical protein MMC20_004465 [Loxospora ochrophaea]|nr:hypothetical protein [Loxospora ochrophaea]
MSERSASSSLCLHKELRADLEPLRQHGTIHVQLPSIGTFARSSHAHRRILDRIPSPKDEETFSKQRIATSGGLYFRGLKRYPRSVLWRCLEEDRLLEFRSVDLSKGKQEVKEASLIFRVAFPSVIRRNGVALADQEDHDALNVFVLTKSNELYTFTLRPDFFCRPTASEDDVERWCKSFRPASFSLSTPHRLFARSSLELLVALGDGRLMRLSRKPGDDGSVWQETAYHEGNWGSSLRGLIRWQGSNTVRYDGIALDQNTAVAIAPSPDGRHVYTVGLNHSIKSWNLKTGKVGVTRDLEDRTREPQEMSKVMLDPSTSRILQVFEAEGAVEGDLYYVVTFSPHESGTFKFWAIRDADDADYGVRDLFPETTFKPPDPDPDTNAAAWSMSDFKIRSAPGGVEMEMWIVMRLGMRYRLYSRIFNLLDLPESWNRDWSTMAFEKLDRQSIPEISSFHSRDVTDEWLDFIFYSRRFPEAILETSLLAYCQGHGIALMAKAKASLKERVASTIGAQVRLQQISVEEADFEKFRENVNDEWLTFWQYIKDLDQKRWEVLSLAYDDLTSTPWIVFADGVCTVRKCAQAEIIVQNRSQDLNRHLNLLETPSIETDDGRSRAQLPDELSMLIEAAGSFRRGFGPWLLQSCGDALKCELWQNSSFSMPDRLRYFDERCDFANEIGKRQRAELSSALQDLGGFEGLDTSLFRAIIGVSPRTMSHKDSGLIYTKFGLKALVRGAQEMIELYTRVYTDLLFLVVFIQGQVNQPNTLTDNLDAPRVFAELLDVLKRYQMMQWLAANTRVEPNKGNDQNTENNQVKQRGQLSGLENSQTSTILENLFALDMKPQSHVHQSQSAALTNSIEDLLNWITRGSDTYETFVPLDNALVHIQCNLLKSEDVALASSFFRFQPSTPWATYIKGRLFLARNELAEAAIHFKKAAYNLCKNPPFHPIPLYPKPPTNFSPALPSSSLDYHLASSTLLTPHSASLLSSSLPSYYTHIISLFTLLPSTSTYTSLFARLALSSLPPPPHSPTPDPHTSTRTDLLSHLFHASLALSSYATAFSTLLLYPSPPLQRSALSSLLTSMLATNHASDLLALPFPPHLASQLDALLVAKIKPNPDASVPRSSSSSDKSAPAAGSLPFWKLLYAWRVRRGDFRGAAAVVVDRLPLGGEGDGAMRARKKRTRGADDGLVGEWLVALNALASCQSGGGASGGGSRGGSADGDGWVLVGGADGRPGRKVVRLEDVRRGYAGVLDRKARLESGRWGIVGWDGNEEDGDGDEEEREGGEEMEMDMV